MGRYRRYIIALAVVFLLVCLYAAAGFLAVPYFARKLAVDFVRSHYARTLTLGEIHFNPFTLTLDVRGARLPDADGQTLLSFERLHVETRFASLWRFAPSFREIVLEQPYVRAVLRPGGELNLADLGKGFAPAPKPQQPSPPLKLYIDRLAVITGSATFEDRTRAQPFRADFKPIGFELRNFSTRAGEGNLYALNAASPEGERLIWNGTVQLSPVASHGTFQITDLRARTVWSYLRDSVAFEVDTGMIGIKGDYAFSAGPGPLSLDVTVHDTRITGLGAKPKGADAHYVEVADLDVSETRVSLEKRSVEVAKVLLSGGELRLWISEQGRVNLRDLVSPEAPAAASPPPAPTGRGAAAPAWSLSVPDVEVRQLKLSAEDREVTPTAALTLDPVNLHVAGFNTSPDDTLDVTLDSAIAGGGKLNARAKVATRTAAVTGQVELAGLALTVAQPYISRYSSMTLLKGSFGTKLDIESRADGFLGIKGNAQVADLRTVDNAQKRDFITWKELKVANLDYRSSPTSLRIGTITAVEPYVRMIIAPDRTLNITEILKPPGAHKAATRAGTAGEVSDADVEAASAAAAAPPPPPPQPASKPKSKGKHKDAVVATKPAQPLTPFPMSIATVRFVNATANYSDLWIKPSFSIGVQTLNGTVTGLSSDPASRAKVQLEGKLDRYSPLQVAGEVNLLSAALYTDIKMNFKDLDLTVVNPYSGYFTGYQIAKGKLSVDVSYKIDERRLTAEQHFVVDQLELGDRVESADATHLPLKLAVALLKDHNGVIDLNFPMTGSLDDPKFRVGPIIWKMFVNLIAKAATAPFALLGHLFGGGEHVNLVAFDPGSAELDKNARDQLGSIAKGLQARPALKLDVPIVYSAELDRPQIAAQKLQSQLATQAQNSRAGRKHPDTAVETALADPQQHFKLLLVQFKQDMGKDAALPPTAVAAQDAKRGDSSPYDPAISDLNAALIGRIQVPDADLEELGKDRAKAIQDALVTDGKIDPARVFIVNAPPKPQAGDKVKVELAVK
jgi:uncharacterized protein involved in outer membrane biogenesis